MHQDWEKNLKTQIFWIFDKEKRGFFNKSGGNAAKILLF